MICVEHKERKNDVELCGWAVRLFHRHLHRPLSSVFGSEDGVGHCHRPFSFVFVSEAS